MQNADRETALSDSQPGLGFSFRPEGGHGTLLLGERVFFGWLCVDRLELEVPGAAASTPLPAGPETFQRRRTRLLGARLRMEQSHLDRYVSGLEPRLGELGVEALSLRAGEGHMTLAARVREGKNVADVTCRLYAVGRGLGVRVLIGQPLVFGYLPVPAPLIAQKLCAGLLQAGERDPRRQKPVSGQETLTAGLGQFDIDPLQTFLWRTMPAAGWRLPATSGIELASIRVTRSGVELVYGPASGRRLRTDGEPGPLGITLGSAEATAVAESYAELHDADDALLSGDIETALRGYRGELAAGGPDQPHVVERILAVSATHPAYFAEAGDTARQILSRWPESVAAHAALANLAAAQGDTRTASIHYQQLLELVIEDDDSAVCAALAAARLLRTSHPEASTLFYERVLDYMPAHAEASAALTERYTAEGRWHDLVRLLRVRILGDSEPARASREHLRLALVLRDQLGDGATARAELERACALDPGNIKAFEALAEQDAAEGKSTEALGRLDQVAALWAERGDVRAEIHTLVRAARLCEHMGDRAQADARYQRALALDPGDAEALVGAASAARQRGDLAAAIALWKRLVDQGGHAPRASAQYQLELGRSLLAAGDTAGARHALERATQQASGDTAGEAHSLLAGLRRDAADLAGAAAELDAAVIALTRAAESVFAQATADLESLAGGAHVDAEASYGEGKRFLGRAAELSLQRAMLLSEMGQDDGAHDDYKRAHRLARDVDPDRAREAARSLLRSEERRGDHRAQRRWIDALLATQPEMGERMDLLLTRAELRARDADDADGALHDVRTVLAEQPADSKKAVALGLQARLLAALGDRMGQARSLADRAALMQGQLDRAEAEAAAAAAWLEVEDTSAALAAARRAVAQLDEASAASIAAPVATRARLFALLGEMSWRHREWPEVARCYGELLAVTEQPGGEAVPEGDRVRDAFRLGAALDALGDHDGAIAALRRVLAVEAAPGDIRTTTWRTLARLYERAEKLLDAAATYEALATDSLARSSADTRADAWFHAGELHHEAGRAGDAERCLEAALQVIPDHMPALDVLEKLEREQGNHERLAGILSRKIAATADSPGRQKALLGRLAELQYQMLGLPAAARQTYLRALELDRGFRPALRFLAADDLRLGNLHAAADSYERLARELPGDGEAAPGADALSERLAAAETLAEIALRSYPETEPGQVLAARACAVIAELLTVSPGNERLLALLAAIEARVPESAAPSPASAPDEDAAARWRERADQAAERGDHAEHRRCLEELIAAMRAAGAQGKRERARLGDVYLELADVSYDHLGERANARRAMLEAAEAYGAGARRDATLRVLAAQAEADGADDEAALAYERIEPLRLTPADRVSLATVYQRLGRDQRAAQILVEDEDGLTDQGVRLLYALRQDIAAKAESARSLEARAEGAPPDRARALLGEALELYEDALDDAEAAARVRSRLDAFGPRPSAVPTVVVPVPAPSTPAPRPQGKRGTLTLDRPTPQARQSATRTAPGLGLPSVTRSGRVSRAPHADSVPTPAPAGVPDDADAAALEQLAAAAMSASDGKRAAELLARAVELRAHARAADGLGLDAAAVRTIERLREAAEAAGAHDVLIEGLTAAARVERDALLAGALWAEVARITREALGDPEASADALVRAVATNPADDGLVVEADAVLRQIGAYERLIMVYEQHLATLEGPRRARPLLELGRLYRDVLGSVPRAARYFAQAHEADPELADVWLPLADQRVVDDDVAGAIELYEMALERGGLDADTRAFVENRVAALSSDPEVVSGQVGHDMREAAAVEPAAAAAEPAPAPAKPAAEPAPAPVPVPRAASDSDVAAPELEELLAQGRELESHAQWDAAIAAYEVAARGSSDPRPLEAIARLYQELGNGEGVIETFDRLHAATSDRRRRAQLRLRQAHVYRDLLHREGEMYRCLAEAHDSDPRSGDIAYELRYAAMARGDWQTAADLVRLEIEAAVSARDAGALYFELALIYDEKLLDARRALSSYERALELDPDIPAAPRPLARLYEMEGRFADAARMHEQAARTVRDDGQRSHVLQRAAACAERAGDIAGARRLYQLAVVAAVNDQAERSAARAALTRLKTDPPVPAAQPPDASPAAEAVPASVVVPSTEDVADTDRYTLLRTQAEAAGDWVALASLIEARAAAQGSPEDRAAAYYELGRLAETRLRDTSAAVAAYERALSMVPEHARALEALAEIAFERRDWQRAFDLYSRLADGPSPLPADVVAYRRGVAAEGLSLDREALDAFSLAVALSPESRDALAALARVALHVGELDVAVSASEALLGLLPPDDVQAISAARLKLAELCQRAGNVPSAIRYNELVLAENPRSQPALRALYKLYSDSERYDDAARALRSLSSLTTSLPRRADLLYRLGELYRERIGDLDQAADAYLKGIDLDPAHVPTLRRLIDSYWRDGAQGDVLEMADSLLEQSALLDAETDDDTLARAMVAAVLSGKRPLAVQIAAWLNDRLSDELLRLLATSRHSGAVPADSLLEAVITLGELVPALDITAMAEKLTTRGRDDDTRKLAAALRTMHSLRARSR